MKRRHFLTIGLAGFTSTLALATKQSDRKIRVAFIGDSITNNGGYIEFIKENLNEPERFEIFNFGKSSETVSGLSEAIHDPRRPYLFDRLVEILKEGDFDYCFLFYGINDAIYSPFDPKRFRAYQKGIAKASKKISKTGCKVVLLTPTPFDEHAMEPNGGLPLNAYSYKDPYYLYNSEVISKYAEYISSLKNRTVYKTIDTYHEVAKQMNASFGTDRIHPLPFGHEVIAHKILKEMNW